MYYLAMDGGGTKLVGLLFDGEYRPIASARAEGTHLSVYRIEDVRAHITACYQELFADLPRPLQIECLYCICGNSRLYAELLPAGISPRRTCVMDESVSALYAGSLRRSGFVALSGTGSDVFCIQNNQSLHAIGGWGAILGDEGSGVWMARHAMQAAIRAEQGWGEPTRFGDMIKAMYGFSHLWDYVGYLYDTPSPFRRLGELLPLVAEAARAGDAAMQEIFVRGGRIMAAQMCAMLRLYPDMEMHITACGGAWKAHPAMAEAFTEAVCAEFPDATFTLPRFEHVMAGPIRLAMDRGEAMAEMDGRLAEAFPHLLWNHTAPDQGETHET